MTRRAADLLPETEFVVSAKEPNTYYLQSAPPRIVFNNSPIRQYQRKLVQIADLGDKRLSLKGALPIHLEHAGDQMLGYSYDLDELEVADDEWSVIMKMRASIADLYFMLKEDQANLGPVPQQHWAFLQKIVTEV